MSFAKQKNVYLHNEGLKLEDYDVDKVEFCNERLNQLLLNNHPDTSRISTPVNHSKQPSIPSRNATRFGGLKGSWFLPRIPCERTVCRSADFYETINRVAARCGSEPDLPRRSESPAQFPLIFKPQKRDGFNEKPDFVVEGKTVLPLLDSEISSSTRPNTASSQLSNPRLCTPLRREKGQEERYLPPLSVTQCLPHRKANQEKDDKKKIKPLQRSAQFNKYFQCRFGRNLGEAGKDDSSLYREVWKPHNGNYQGGPEERRNAIQKVVQEIYRSRDNDETCKDTDECDQTDLEGFLRCESVKLVNSLEQ